MAGLPEFLKDFDVSIVGTSFNKRAEEIKLPDLVIKTEEWRGAGMDAPIEIDVGMEKMETTMKFAGIKKEVFLAYGLQVGGLAIMNAVGGFEAQDGTAFPVNATLQGGIKKIETGTWKAGDIKSAFTSITMSVNRYLLVMDNFPLVTIDIENRIRIMGAIDHAENIRIALGL